MSRHHGTAAFAAALLATSLSITPVAAQDSGLVRYGSLLVKPDRFVPGKGRIVIPQSSLKSGDPLKARTHYHILVPDRPAVPPSPPKPGTLNPATSISLAETPASLACVYRLVAQSMGCNPNTFFTVATGGTRTIAIVDAFHNPTAKIDLAFFSHAFGLPFTADTLQVVYCNASTCKGVVTPPPVDSGWAGEIALDVQAAHAMAPNAKIILVEAFSNSYANLMRAVDRAAALVAAAGGGQVSNSYGGPDDGTDGGFYASQDFHFVKSGVVFFASTGDHKSGTTVADVEWPSTSPNVVAVGGTNILRNATTQAFQSEQAWIDTGGGISGYANRPFYQNSISAIVGAKRGVPDVAANADPASGMFVYCQTQSCGSSNPWMIIGGTSLASPLMAGMVNAAGAFRTSSALELKNFYGQMGTTKYTDVNTGQCGNGAGGALVNAIAGWDRCTGVGTPKGLSGL